MKASFPVSCFYTITVRSNSWLCRLNGALHFASRNDNTTAFGFNGGTLGGQSTVSLFTGDIAEVLFYTNGLSVADRFNLGAYLNYKFRLFTNTPAAPSNFTAQAVSTSQISLTWDGAQSGPAVTYVLERRIGKTGTSMVVSNVVEDTSCFDTGLSAATTYYYRLKAMNYWGESAWVETSEITLGDAEADLPLSNLFLWFRADAGVIRQTTNGTVACWLNQSGTNDATQITNETASQAIMGPGQPRFLTSEANGRPAIGFNLTNNVNGTNYLVIGKINSLVLTNLTEGEICVVLKSDSGPGTNNGFWNLGHGQYDTRYPAANDRIQDNFGTSNILHQVTSAGHDLTQYHLYRAYAKGTNWANWHNETTLLTKTNITVKFPSTSSGSLDSRIGSTANTVIPFRGCIQEILLFSPVLSDDQTNTVKRYLNEKYGLWNP